MRFKKLLLAFIAIVGLISIFSGCSTTSHEETLTKEQQDNVVKKIARNYNINKIEFVYFEKNLSTGTYDLYFRVNDKKDGPMLPIEKLETLDTDQGAIGLDPIEDYEDIKKSDNYDEESPVDISDITIIYLEE
ncbi:hypothetical protein [Streptococcus sp. CSL10205-OR2]|uniref:hypothetical protein n=1 Tax=Streptococcus sp. CSL10205-OR2 TaxID=2980558 RepID=UPI0021DB466D|nr:hypothetical protein [Streptococcus sp. CSL10205-OR2]MCU9533694.1 hypothetical protein [Streptococcus sp. CSL10205-OR2]